MESIIDSMIRGLAAGSKGTEISDSKSPQAQTGADFKRIVDETLAAEKIRQSGNTLPTAAKHAVKVGAETQLGIFDRLGQSVSLDVLDGDSFDLVVIGDKASVEEAMAFGREAGLSSSTISQLFDGDATKSLVSDGRSLPSSGRVEFQALSLRPDLAALSTLSTATMPVEDTPEAMPLNFSTNDPLRYGAVTLGAAQTPSLAHQDVSVKLRMTAPSALSTAMAPTVPVAETPEAVSLNFSTNDALRYGAVTLGAAPELTVKPNMVVNSDGDLSRVGSEIHVAVTRPGSPNQALGQAVPNATNVASIGQGDEASRTEVKLAHQLSMQSRSERLSGESGRSAMATKTLEYSKYAESRDPSASVFRPNSTEMLVPARSAEMVTAVNSGSIAPPASGLHAEPASGLGQVSPLTAEPQRSANLTQLVAQDQQSASVKEQFLSRFSAELAQRFVSKVQDGTYKLEFDLKPRDLGKIEVIMEYRDGKLDATLSSVNSVTRDILSEGLNRLRDSLMSSGVNLSSLDVASDSERSLRDDTASAGRPAKVLGEGGDQLAATTGDEVLAESYVIDFSNLNIDLWV